MTAYRDVVFVDGDEGREVTDRLCRVEGVVARGATDATIAATITHLMQWETTEADGQVRSELSAGSRDEVVERDGYVLSWNLGLGYVALSAVVR